MDPNTRALMMGAAGSGSKTIPFVATITAASPYTSATGFPRIRYDGKDSIIYACDLARSGGLNTFLCKFNLSGTLAWQQILSHSGYPNVSVKDIAIDSSQNIYVLVSKGTSSFTYVQLLKYSPAGTLLSQTEINYFDGFSSYSLDPQSLTIDSSGNILIVAGGITQFLAYTNSSGTLTSQVRQNGSQIYTQLGIIFDPISSLFYLRGRGFNPTTGRNNTVLLAKISSSGSITWSTLYDNYVGGDQSAGSNSIAVDSSGNPYIITSENSNNNAQTVKFNSSGTKQWESWRYTAPNSPAAYGLTVDATGNVYTLPWTTSYGAPYKINSSGSTLWQARTTGTLYPTSITNDQKNHYCLGLRSNSTTFGCAVFPGDGTKTGTYSGITYASSSDSISNNSGNVYSTALSYTPVTWLYNSSSNPVTSTTSSLSVSIQLI